MSLAVAYLLEALDLVARATYGSNKEQMDEHNPQQIAREYISSRDAANYVLLQTAILSRSRDMLLQKDISEYRK